MENEADPVRDAASLPLAKRVSHNHWKVREAAFVELKSRFAQTIDEDDKIFEEYSAGIGKMLRDVNAAAQLSALEVAAKVAECASIALCQRISADVGKALVHNVFNGRPINRQKGMEVYELFVQADGTGVTEALCQDGFAHKTIKVVVACASAITSALSTYGASALPLAAIGCALLKLLEHTHNDVRAVAKSLATELHRWAGDDALRPALKSLKPVTVKELETAFAQNAYGDRPKPTKLQRGRRAHADEHAARGSAANGEDSSVGGQEPELIKLELRQEIDLTQQLSIFKVEVNDERITWSEAVVSTNWNARKTALDAFVSALDGRKLKAGSDVADELAKLRKILNKDLNVNVAAAAARAVAALCSSAGSALTEPMAKPLCVALLARLKEKNRVIHDAAMAALEALHENNCLSLAACTDELNTASGHKVAAVREALLQWLRTCVRRSTAARTQPAVKDLVALAIRMSEDATAPVRDAALSLLASLVLRHGARMSQAAVEKLDKLRVDKLQALVNEEMSDGKTSPATATGSGRSETPLAPSSGAVTSENASMRTENCISVQQTTTTPLDEKGAVDSVEQAIEVDTRATSFIGAPQTSSTDVASSSTAMPTQKAAATDNDGRETTLGEAESRSGEEPLPFLQDDPRLSVAELEKYYNDIASSQDAFQQLSARSLAARKDALDAAAAAVRVQAILSVEGVSAALYALQESKALSDHRSSPALAAALELFLSVIRGSRNAYPRHAFKEALFTLTGRLGDLRHGEKVQQALLQVAECTCAAYTLRIVQNSVLPLPMDAATGSSAPAPRVLLGACSLARSMLLEFGIANSPVEPVEALCTAALRIDADAVRSMGASLIALWSMGANDGDVIDRVKSCCAGNNRALEEIETALSRLRTTSRGDTDEASADVVGDDVSEGRDCRNVRTSAATTVRDDLQVLLHTPPRRSRCWTQPGTLALQPARRQAVRSVAIEDDRKIPPRSDSAASSSPGTMNSEVLSSPMISVQELTRKLGDRDWSCRAQALETLSQEPMSRLHGDTAAFTSLLTELCTRLSDSNRNLAVAACTAMTRLIAASPPLVSPEQLSASATNTLPALMQAMTKDTKKVVRDAAARCLQEWSEAASLSIVLNCSVVPLHQSSSSARKELLNWLLVTLDRDSGSRTLPVETIVALFGATLAAVSDKAQDVRYVAEQLLRELEERAVRLHITDALLEYVRAYPPAKSDTNSRTVLSRLHTVRGWDTNEGGASGVPPKTNTTPPPSERQRVSPPKSARQPSRVRSHLPTSQTKSREAASSPMLARPLQQENNVDDEAFCGPHSGLLQRLRTEMVLPTPARTKELADIMAEPTPAVVNRRTAYNHTAGSRAASKIAPTSSQERHKERPASGDDAVKAGDGADTALIVGMLRCNDVSKRVGAVRKLCKLLSAVDTDGSHTSESNSLSLASHASDIAELLNANMQTAFTQALAEPQKADYSRELNYYVNGLLQLLSKPLLAALIRRRVLDALIKNFLSRCCEIDLSQTLPNGANVSRALNLLLLRLLEHGQRPKLYSIMLEWLGALTARVERGEALSSADVRSRELLIKCVLKLSKKGYKDVPLQLLLRDINAFFRGHPRAQLPAAAGDDALLALRCVKTLLGDIVRSHGESVLEHLSLVKAGSNLHAEDDEALSTGANETPIVPYINAMLSSMNSGSKARGTEPTMAISPIDTPSLASITPTPSPPKKTSHTSTGSAVSGEDERAARGEGVQFELAAIFGKIGERQSREEGVRDLHAFLVAHPNVDVNSRLGVASPQFQRFIHKRLDELDELKTAPPRTWLNQPKSTAKRLSPSTRSTSTCAAQGDISGEKENEPQICGTPTDADVKAAVHSPTGGDITADKLTQKAGIASPQAEEQGVTQAAVETTKPAALSAAAQLRERYARIQAARRRKEALKEAH